MPKQAPDNVPSLRAIAREAGVSLSTASCALRGKPGVSQATMAKVRAVAGRLGWKANPLVSAWLTHVRGLRQPADFGGLAYVVASTLGMKTYLSDARSKVYQEYFQGAREQAAKRGYHLEPFDYFELGPRRLTQVLRARNIQGMILAPDIERSLDIEWQHFSVVEISHSVVDPPLHRVANHHFNNTKHCVENLLRLGYRRIGLGVSKWSDGRSDAMLSGGFYTGIFNAPGVEYIPPRWLEGLELERRTLLKWLKAGRLEALITGTAGICELVEEWNAAGKCKVVIAHTDKHPAQEYTRHWGGINRHPHRLGAAAVDMLTFHVDHNERGIPENPKVLLFEGEWMDGPSTPPIK